MERLIIVLFSFIVIALAGVAFLSHEVEKQQIEIKTQQQTQSQLKNRVIELEKELENLDSKIEKNKKDIDTHNTKNKTNKNETNKNEKYVVTAYTQRASEGTADGIMANGETVHRGAIACPPELAFGTKVYIHELNKTYTCKDRGSAIQGKRLDIFMWDLQRALDFGKQTLTVEVLK